MSEHSRIPPIQMETAKARQAAMERSMMKMMITQEVSQEGFQDWIDSGVFNPTLMSRRFESLESKRRRSNKEEEAEKAEKKQKEVTQVERIEKTAQEFQRQNKEFQIQSLLILRERINLMDTKEEILRKVLEMYPDYSLADEALDFLLQTSDGELAEKVRQARADLNKTYGREVKAGKNIAEQAREFSEKGLGTPTGLRDLYREVTGNPRDPNTLFNELTLQFTYEDMKTVIEFLLHSLGGDLKSKGPSIDRGELHRLLSETRKLQSILALFVFFKSRMKLIQSAFQRSELTLPAVVTFELMAKQFMRMVQERYPSADKIIQLAVPLNIPEDVLAQIILFTQMRDAIRQTAPRLFKSEQQKQDLLTAFIDAIEELDESLEEEEEE